ncbi:MAG TPA: DUF1320 domain-containing protein [bacterium]|nr:DUF1320 domain-containing protein [bacterium]
MPYSALADLVKVIDERELIQLSNDDTSATAVNAVNVAQAITDADNLIDGYVSGRYSLPLAPVPGLIKKISVDLAVYNLWARRRRAEMPEGIENSYKNAIKLLERMQEGKILLSATQIPSGNEASGGLGDMRVNKTAADRVFNKDLMEKF